MTDREFAVDVVRTLQAAGHRAMFAGGCVRDELLGLTPLDYDVATDATPDRVKALFRRRVEVGAAFGVIEVIGPKDDRGEWLKVQVATFRSDGAYTDGRRPDSVTFGSAEEDATRRDFTVNGLFSDPITGDVFDYVGGRADLAAKILRAIGDPVERFTEDKLRILRAVRMAARFDLSVDPATSSAGRAMADQIKAVSAERIADEFRKMLAHPQRGRAVQLFREFGLEAPVLPEMTPAGEAAVAALPPTAGFPLALAALMSEATPHEAEVVCRRLKLSNDETHRVEFLVEHRLTLVDAARLKPSRLYPLLAHPGGPDLVTLRRADGGTADAEYCENLLRTKSTDELDPQPLLTGDDLIAAGWKPGRAFKVALDMARAAQLDGDIQTKDDAVALASRVANSG
jgi:tRNA nucleotidyltransferase/poly(A) polymerase